jgi:hypothetical protein
MNSLASGLIYTIQTGSYVHEKDALKYFEYVAQGLSEKDRGDLRVVKVGEYYAVRFGRFESYANANNLKKAVTPEFPDALILKTNIQKNALIKMYAAETIADAPSVKHDKEKAMDSLASELIYTIQTGSYVHEKDALKHFEYVAQELSEKDRGDLRVVKVGDYYAVRFGRFESYANANNLKKAVTPEFPDALILRTNIQKNALIKMYAAETIADAPSVKHDKEKAAGSFLVEITADSLNIMSGPSTDTEVIGKLIKGRKIFSFVHDKDWLKVLTESNQEGYIFSRYTMIITDFSTDTLTPHIRAQEGVFCDEETAGLSLTIEDVSFNCKWNYFGNESKGCATEFNVSVHARCDADITVYVDCEADISYDTKYGYFPSQSKEYGYDKVSVSSGKGTSFIVLNWNARSYFDPVVRAKLKDGSCNIGKVFSYYK